MASYYRNLFNRRSKLPLLLVFKQKSQNKQIREYIIFSFFFLGTSEFTYICTKIATYTRLSFFSLE